MAQNSYKKTISACFISYITTAITVNFAPLLFLTFSRDYGIPLSQMTLLVTVNFLVQIATDLVASKYAAKIGYRKCLVAAHVLSAAGLVMMTVLPEVMPSLAGLLCAVVLYAIGGGLLEVLISPLVEACPTKNKAGVMSIMHSFYCWGSVFAVLVSTLYFHFFGIQNWKILACIWTIIPIINIFLFSTAPIYTLDGDGDEKDSYHSLFSQKVFYLMLIMMLCAGASELSVSQWASALAESALGVSKQTGDLLGACGFAAFMGLSRVLYGKFSEKLPMKKALAICSVLCIISYLLIALPDSPALGLIGCMLCGFSVGIFWPGSCSLAASSVRGGGTTMFALLAFFGDIGCSAGPTTVGFLQDAFGGDLRTSMIFGAVFPFIMLVAILLSGKKEGRGNKVSHIEKT